MTAETMQHWLAALTALVLLSACANPSGTSAGFEDNFDARNGWMLISNAQADVAIQGGQLLITVKKPDSLAWTTAQGKVFDDLSLDVDATALAGPDDNAYGVIVRHADDDKLYRFEISGDGYYNIQKRVKGKWEQLVPDWTPSNAIRQGRVTNHLRVTCAGDVMTFSVNQIQLAQVKDTSLARGAIGLVAGTLTQPDVHVAFDHLKVTR
jgi:hypothetical protein